VTAATGRTRRRSPVNNLDRAARVERFFGRHLRHMKGRWAGQPFTLETWQRDDIIRPLFGTIDPRGRRRYREALIGLPRKNGKSEIAAGIAIYGLVSDGEFGAEVYSLAGDRKQASIVFATASAMIRASPILSSACKVYRSVIEVPETGAIYRALSADADLQHGLNPSIAVIDEYHVHKSSEQYEAMRTGTAARAQPLIATITTAGPARSGPAWDLYLRAKAGRDPRLFFYWRGADDEDDSADRKVWRKANPASWVTLEFLADQRRSLPAEVFERLHLNRWPTGGAGGWLPSGAWEACGDDPLVDPELPCIIAVDAAPKRDKTAVVLVQRDADGVHHALCWSFQADPDLGYFDFEIIEQLLRDLAQDFFVTRIAFDPYAMMRSMMMLAAEGLPVEEFPQGHARMVPASMGLHEIIVQRRLRHGGSPDLTEGVLGSRIRETSFGWRLDKLSSWKAGYSNDAAVALAMATHLAEQEAAESGGPTVVVV
jgi:phage terminase large subunit-like protein